MKITGGKHNSRRLGYPKGIRPTSDKVREAVFGVLGERVKDAKILDLYAGSGALGLEALSRGAVSLTTVDNQNGSVAAIRKNAGELNEEVLIVFQDVAKFIEGCSDKFDLIFADPPYEEIDWEIIASAAKLLDFDGLLVVEYSARVLPPDQMEAAHEVDRRRYGDTQIIFLQKT
jgi:16S rRNA (guanine(966)-N(2))-methyltransferase RsmD